VEAQPWRDERGGGATFNLAVDLSAHVRSTVHNCVMDTDLTAIKTALADISDTDLHALIAATYGVPQTAPGLLVWIDGTCDWELNRRRGHSQDLFLIA